MIKVLFKRSPTLKLVLSKALAKLKTKFLIKVVLQTSLWLVAWFPFSEAKICTSYKSGFLKGMQAELANLATSGSLGKLDSNLIKALNS